jgi:hypothetical protein
LHFRAAEVRIVAKRPVRKAKSSRTKKTTKTAKTMRRSATASPAGSRRPTKKAVSKKAVTKKAVGKKAAAKKTGKRPVTKGSATRPKAPAAETAVRASSESVTPVSSPSPFAPSDPSKAPGKLHRHPPMNLRGVKHSQAYVAKARTPFKLRQGMGR